MTPIAFIYPGQGSQRVGMGAALRASDPELYDSWLEAAEAATGMPLRRYIADGPIDTLTRTDVAQPALLALSLALTEAARRVGLEPAFVAGHSLGECTAAVAAGALSSDDGLRFVAERGRLMAEVQAARPGGMGAILGLAPTHVRALCEASGGVEVANLNAPSQVVIAGEEADVERALVAARTAGAARAVRLQVGAAFHNSAMDPVRERISRTASLIEWHDPRVPLVANVSGAALRRAEELRSALISQITSEVRWIDCVRTIVEAGCRTFVELGPGRVLCGLVRQIERSAEVIAAESPEVLESLASRLGVRPRRALITTSSPIEGVAHV